MDTDNKTHKKESVKELEEKLDKVTEKWKRAAADYVNLEKRVDKERETVSQIVRSLIIVRFLPILDSLEAAAKKSSDSGFDLIIKQFKEILHKEGVVEIKALGERFDPQEHEAVDVVEAVEKNKVIEVLRQGYMINDKVLRAAQVIVSKDSKGGT